MITQNSAPVVSVLMCTYNEPLEWIDKAIESIRRQTFTNFEYIIVDDNPNRQELKTYLINKSKSDKLLKIVFNKENIGLTKSLNIGLGYCRGEYIARMDSDDISMPNRFALQVDYLRNHPDVAVVGGSIREFNATNDCVNIRHYPETNEEAIGYICKASPCAHPAVMMRRSIFEGGISYNEKYRTSQDLALWYDLLCVGYKINNMKDVVLKFRLSDDIFNRRSRVYAKNEFKIYCNGIYRLYGFFSWRYVYPLFRYLFRLMPVNIIQWIYNSDIRKKILQKKYVQI